MRDDLRDRINTPSIRGQTNFPYSYPPERWRQRELKHRTEDTKTRLSSVEEREGGREEKRGEETLIKRG